MGLSQKWSVVVVVVLLIAGVAWIPCSLAATHIVGGSLLWRVPASNTAYSAWATGETFAPGDTLIFNFTTGAHDVAEVSSSDYTSCNSSSPLRKVTEGPATLNLTAGIHNYICTIDAHCTSGQKLSITVTSETATPTTPPTTTNTTSPPPPSAAAPLAGFAVISFSVISAVISYLLYV